MMYLSTQPQLQGCVCPVIAVKHHIRLEPNHTIPFLSGLDTKPVKHHVEQACGAESRHTYAALHQWPKRKHGLIGPHKTLAVLAEPAQNLAGFTNHQILCRKSPSCSPVLTATPTHQQLSRGHQKPQLLSHRHLKTPARHPKALQTLIALAVLSSRPQQAPAGLFQTDRVSWIRWKCLSSLSGRLSACWNFTEWPLLLTLHAHVRRRDKLRLGCCCCCCCTPLCPPPPPLLFPPLKPFFKRDFLSSSTASFNTLSRTMSCRRALSTLRE